MHEASSNSRPFNGRGMSSYNSLGANDSVANIGNFYNSTNGKDSSAQKFIDSSL